MLQDLLKENKKILLNKLEGLKEIEKNGLFSIEKSDLDFKIEDLSNIDLTKFDSWLNQLKFIKDSFENNDKENLKSFLSLDLTKEDLNHIKDLIDFEKKQKINNIYFKFKINDWSFLFKGEGHSGFIKKTKSIPRNKSLIKVYKKIENTTIEIDNLNNCIISIEDRNIELIFDLNKKGKNKFRYILNDKENNESFKVYGDIYYKTKMVEKSRKPEGLNAEAIIEINYPKFKLTKDSFFHDLNGNKINDIYKFKFNKVLFSILPINDHILESYVPTKFLKDKQYNMGFLFLLKNSNWNLSISNPERKTLSQSKERNYENDLMDTFLKLHKVDKYCQVGSLFIISDKIDMDKLNLNMIEYFKLNNLC